jgi:hypothetical protein
MNVEIGTQATQFLFWEYLFRILATASLQCTSSSEDWLQRMEYVHKEDGAWLVLASLTTGPCKCMYSNYLAGLGH